MRAPLRSSLTVSTSTTSGETSNRPNTSALSSTSNQKVITNIAIINKNQEWLSKKEDSTTKA